jgi:hypothetical protein
MEFTWRYAWVFFLSLIILNRPLPLAECLSLFILASVVTSLCRRRYRRLYQAWFLHFFGFTVAWLVTIYRFNNHQMPFFNSSWLAQELKHLQNPQQWFIHLLIVACLLLFWLGARAMVKRPRRYFPVCLQFDKGLGVLFLLLLIKFMVQEKGGLRLEDPVTIYLLFAYITFSLIAICLSRNQSDVQKTFRSGYHGIGIVLGFASVVFVLSAMLAVLLLPYITLMAYSAQSIIKETTEPMSPYIVGFIRFLFSIGKYRREMGGQITGGLNANQLYPDTEIDWAQSLGWFLFAVIGLLALGLCGYWIYLWVCRFLNRNTPDKSRPLPFTLLTRLFAIIGAIWQLAWNGLLFLLKRIDSAAAVYAGLLRWGRRSGLPAVASETPAEYGERLKQWFPQLDKEIELIIEAFNREIYGQIAPDNRALAGIRFARGRMRSPRYWPARMKAWFAPPPKKAQTSPTSEPG